MCTKIRAQAKEAAIMKWKHCLLMLAFLKIYTADSHQPQLQSTLARAQLDVTSSERGIQLLRSARGLRQKARWSLRTRLLRLHRKWKSLCARHAISFSQDVIGERLRDELKERFSRRLWKTREHDMPRVITERLGARLGYVFLIWAYSPRDALPL